MYPKTPIRRCQTSLTVRRLHVGDVSIATRSWKSVFVSVWAGCSVLFDVAAHFADSKHFNKTILNDFFQLYGDQELFSLHSYRYDFFKRETNWKSLLLSSISCEINSLKRKIKIQRAKNSFLKQVMLIYFLLVMLIVSYYVCYVLWKAEKYLSRK